MGSSLVSNHFTRQGIDMCTKVCKTQLDKILKVYPTTVVLKDMYCSRSGIRMASCICEFKISCQVNIHSVLIHFIVNRDGYLAVFDEEVGKPYLFWLCKIGVNCINDITVTSLFILIITIL